MDKIKELEAELRSILETEGALSDDQVARADEVEKELDSLMTEKRSNETRDRLETRLSKGKFEFTNLGADDNSALQRYADWALLGKEYRAAGDHSTSTSTDGQGGYLVPLDLQNELVKRMNGVAAARQVCDVRNYGFDVEIARVAERPSIVDFTGEGANYDAVGVTFDQIRSYAFKSAAESYITEELLQDARPEVISEILESHADAHALFWDGQYLASGAGGAAGPDKIFNASQTGLNVHTSATIDTIKLDDLYAAYFESLPAQYRSGNFAWVCHPTVESVLRQEEDTTGRKLLDTQAMGNASTNGVFNTSILGMPLYVSTQAPTYTAAKGDGTIPAIMLVEKSSYRIFDRLPFITQRDEYSKGSQGKVIFRSKMRSDGKWVAPWRSLGIALKQS